MRVCRKVRFIEPHGRQGRPFNVWLAKWPLLGPITLATILHERGYDAAVYNENVSGPLTENSAAYQDICSADVVGFSIMTPTAARGYQLADQIKRDAPKARIVFGGIHATFMTSEALVHGDIVVRGEGERVIEQIASGEIESGVVTGLPLENLDSIPTLNYELMRDFDTLILRAYRRDLYDLPVMASRGCPYRCTFCSVSRMFGQQVRRQSTGKVWKDLSRYREQGFRRFFFYDDNFTSNREWTRDLMGKIKPLDIRYSAQTRADFHWLDGPRSLLDRPLLHAMREAGGYVLYIGYETIDDSTASEWRKGYRGGHMLRERLVEDTRILHGNDFWIHGMFVVGPQHGMETMDQIVRFARQTKIETMQISILTPFPGTPLFDQMRPHVIFREFPQDWDFYDGTHCVYRHGRLGIRGLQEAVLEAHRRFYRRHGLSLRRIRDAFEQKVPLGDRLRVLWSNARVASKTLRQWNEETKMFLELASRREATSLNR
jgi:radical SAM superfamily enzyme YgiQ (UPF0313 family)